MSVTLAVEISTNKTWRVSAYKIGQTFSQNGTYRHWTQNHVRVKSAMKSRFSIFLGICIVIKKKNI